MRGLCVKGLCVSGLCASGAWAEGRCSAGRLWGRVPAARCPRIHPARRPTPTRAFPSAAPRRRPGRASWGEGSTAFARPVPPSSPASRSPSLPPPPGLPFLSSFSAVPLPRHVPQPGSLRRAAPVAPPAAGGAGPRCGRGAPLLEHGAVMGGSWGGRGEQRENGTPAWRLRRLHRRRAPPAPRSPRAAPRTRTASCASASASSTRSSAPSGTTWGPSTSCSRWAAMRAGGAPRGGRRGGLSAGGSGEQLVEVPAAGPIRAGGISCAERRRAGDARAVTGSDPGMRLLRGTPRPFCCCCEVVLLFVKSSAFVACYL